MKFRIACLILAASVSMYGQGRPSSHPGGMPSGAGSQGMGTGMGSSGSMGSPNHGSMGSNHGDMGTMHDSSANMGKQSPDAILSRNSQLNSNLQKLLPQGTTAQQACSGYKNLGDCVAAIHVSSNLGIPFSDLKAKTTGSSAESLGKAIQTLKPDVNAKTEVKKAKKQANADLSSSSS